jgi:hypothetical protein
MVFISTVAATSFLPLLPARNYLICNPCPPKKNNNIEGNRYFCSPNNKIHW